MPADTHTPAHLRAIDPDVWPSVVSVPTGTRVRLRARAAEAGFARACADASITVGLDDASDIIVDHEELFTRIATGGWIGLAESYMAGEWRTDTSAALVDVVTRLMRTGYNPKTAPVELDGSFRSGGIPPELVARFAGDDMSAFAGHFATGVSTTQRVKMRSHAPRAGKGNEPAAYFMSVTDIEAPLETQKPDLADAQSNTVAMLLDAAAVRPGTHLLEVPCSGGAIAIEAAKRRATVDAIALDGATADAVSERLTLAGVDDAVRLGVMEAPERTLARRAGRYDAVVSAEHLETVTVADRVRYFQVFDQMLVPGGRAAVQMVVGTEALKGPAASAVESLRAFIWPALNYETIETIVKQSDQKTGLRVQAITHAPSHLQLSLNHQRQTFDSHAREAAAVGFDAVYRRLWLWQFAVREALARLGAIDLVQITLGHRNRRGLR